MEAGDHIAGDHLGLFEVVSVRRLVAAANNQSLLLQFAQPARLGQLHAPIKHSSAR